MLLMLQGLVSNVTSKFTIDTTASRIANVLPVNNTVIDVTSATISFDVTDAQEVKLSINGGSNITLTSADTGETKSYSYTMHNLIDGNYSFTIYAVDRSSGVASKTSSFQN